MTVLQRLLSLALRAAVVLGCAALAAAGPGAAGTPDDLVTVHVAALADADAGVRENAAAALGRIGPAAVAAIDPLVAAFADPDPYVAGAAAIALARIGPAAVPALVRALADPNEDVRWSAAITLGRLGDGARDAAPALTRALGDANGNVRSCSATALGAIGPPAAGAVAGLTEALHDRDEDVRHAARLALARIVPGWRAPPDLATIVATVERLVPALMDELHVPGVSIAVIRDRGVAWSKPFGVADAATGTPVTRETLFEAASMSKPVFAVLVMQLADAGRLDLDRPLDSYAREPHVPDQPGRRRVTARMVLSHTAGFPNWRPGGEEREGPLPLLFEPGARFAYSGEGMFYLQRVVERITGRTLEAQARAALFAPLGLTHSSFAWSPEVDLLLASGHREDGTVLTRSRYTHPNAAYTLYTTAGEYARLVVEVMEASRSHSKLLGRKAAREMQRRQVALDAREPIERPGAAAGRSVHWGLGWSVNTTAAGDILHHSGANRTGFRCFAQFSPERGSGLVILTNGLGGGELWTRLVAAVGDL